VLAVMLACGLVARANADDSSWGAVDKPSSTYVVTDTSDLTTNVRCGTVGDEDPFWQTRSNGTVGQAEPSTALPADLPAEPVPLFRFGPPNPVF
jgi:hypothetical protein